MTVQAISGMTELWIPQHSRMLYPVAGHNVTMNASSEGTHLCGNIWLPARTGTKTLSAAGGGKIHWATGSALTWANASTRLRVGIQPLATSTIVLHGTGVYDVYHELIPGTDTLSASTWTTTTMTSGTVDLTHNEPAVIAIEMTVGAGADSVLVRSASTGATINYPGVTAVTSGPSYAAQLALPNAVIEFDDGTFGFIHGSWVSSNAGGNLVGTHSIDTGDNPDEVCNIMQFPYACDIDALFCVLDNNSTGAFELILYSDPEGTPVAERTLTFDADTVNTTTNRPFQAPLSSIYSVPANTKIGVAVRPTTATLVDVNYFDVAATGHFQSHPLGANCYQGHRQNQTGAFTTTTTRRIFAGVCISGLSDDSAVGGSGGGMRIVGPGGLAG